MCSTAKYLFVFQERTSVPPQEVGCHGINSHETKSPTNLTAGTMTNITSMDITGSDP